MKPPRIPPRAPIGDSFKGVMLKANDVFLLAETPLAGAETVHEGSFILRYGVVYLGKPHLSIVPALLALDYGAFKTGEDAWDFLLNKSNLFPRADVLGFGNDGADSQVFIKELDLMYPFDIHGFELVAWTAAIAPEKKHFCEYGKEVPKEKHGWVKEPEIIWLPHTRSLCIQGHPEEPYSPLSPSTGSTREARSAG